MHFTQWRRVMTHTPCQSQRPWFSPVKPDLNNSIQEIIVELAGIRFNTFARYDWTLADDRWDRKSGSKGIIFQKLQLTLWDGPQVLSSRMLICIKTTHVNPPLYQRDFTRGKQLVVYRLADKVWNNYYLWKKSLMLTSSIHLIKQ